MHEKDSECTELSRKQQELLQEKAALMEKIGALETREHELDNARGLLQQEANTLSMRCRIVEATVQTLTHEISANHGLVRVRVS